MKHNPPTVTRSYKSNELMRAKDHFDLVKLLLYLDPGGDEWNTIYAASVSHTAYGTTRGAKSPFPAPIDFVDVHYGFGDEEEPVWPDLYMRNRSLLMSRVISRLIERFNELEVNSTKTVTCPICDKDSIQVGVGNPLIWDKKMEVVRVDPDHERAVSISIGCDCKGFQPIDFMLAEEQI